MGKIALAVGQLEQHVADAAPLGLARLAPAHRGRQRLEAAPRHPQLAVQGQGRQMSAEPGRRSDRLPATAEQLAAVPEGPHAVQLLADPVAANLQLGRGRLGQQQGGRLGRLGLGRPDRQQPGQCQALSEAMSSAEHHFGLPGRDFQP
jgi:hypothetical protein